MCYENRTNTLASDTRGSGADGFPFARVIDPRPSGLNDQSERAIDGHAPPLTLSVADTAALHVDDRLRIRLDPRRTFVFPAIQDL